jgi:putative phosphoesterase
MSDSHGKVTPLNEIMRANENADVFFFLGDGDQDIMQIVRNYPDRVIHRVRGNCDFGRTLPLCITIDVEYTKHRITAVHGNLQNVKYKFEGLIELAEYTKSDIILYGHTHKSDIRYEDGIYYICPGSVSEPRDESIPTYAVIDFTDNGGVLPTISPVPPYKLTPPNNFEYPKEY